MDPYIGELRLFGFTFAPVGWALCNGQVLSISQNAALFSILGTQYGGNGTSNFALPNLQGQVPIGQGTGPGLTPFDPGSTGGEQTHTLVSSEMPAHSHSLTARPVASVNTTPAAGSSHVGRPWRRTRIHLQRQHLHHQQPRDDAQSRSGGRCRQWGGA